MIAQTRRRIAINRAAAHAAPIVAVLLAGWAGRTALAAQYPAAAVVLLLWIVADTAVLSLMVRASRRRPGSRKVIGALAMACIATWVISSPPLRAALLSIPALAAIMAAVVLAHALWGIARARQAWHAGGANLGDRLRRAAEELLPPALVRFAAAELALLHMAFWRWGGPPDVPARCRSFAYHRHLAPMSATLLVLSAIEVGVYHIFLGHWNRTAALVMFVVSDLGLIYLVGLIKSFRLRPILLTPEGVRVRAGLMIDQLIPYDRIAGLETAIDGDVVRSRDTLNAALLAWPNMMLRLDRPIARTTLSRRRAFSRVAFRLDDPEPFAALLRWRLGQS